ncbi:MAG TPA: hypothetical protein VFW44_03635 [Bryobacteraceae bacterium]|nr:hypothetical protein [Bryobacteraceae bacterium]
MNRSVFRLMMSIGIPLVSAAAIELLPQTRVAQVPFQFQVANRTLPPGTYAIRKSGLGRGICIQNQKADASASSCTPGKGMFGRSEPARLVFDDQDGQYRLAEIWFDADGHGMNLQRSANRKNEAREEKSVWLR